MHAGISLSVHDEGHELEYMAAYALIVARIRGDGLYAGDAREGGILRREYLPELAVYFAVSRRNRRGGYLEDRLHLYGKILDKALQMGADALGRVAL